LYLNTLSLTKKITIFLKFNKNILYLPLIKKPFDKSMILIETYIQTLIQLKVFMN